MIFRALNEENQINTNLAVLIWKYILGALPRSRQTPSKTLRKKIDFKSIINSFLFSLTLIVD